LNDAGTTGSNAWIITRAGNSVTQQDFVTGGGAPRLSITDLVTTTSNSASFTGAGGSAAPAVSIASATPVMEFNHTAGGADAKKWNWLAGTNTIGFRTLNDAANIASPVWTINRSGNAATQHDFYTNGVSRLNITDADIGASASYNPVLAKSLTTKDYVDAKLPAWVAGASAVGQAANVNAPAVYAVPASGMYRVSTFIVITQAATTSATMPSVNVLYTEAVTGVAASDLVTLSAAANAVGTRSGGTAVIQAQQGSNIGYSTSDYASVGATPMQYQVRIAIERLQ
jgi:hypothetical protein